uniref:Cyclin N-terminal domain-containing protein n=1 Tax=Laticauda laticaudata TaxID=8630 RepID=A0A8C5WWD3_LATLA
NYLDRRVDGTILYSCHCYQLELKLPVYKAHSLQIERRRYFAHLLTVLSSHCQLCPMARHLAVYLLDIFMDRYDVTVKQLYVVSIACLLLASRSPYLMVEKSYSKIWVGSFSSKCTEKATINRAV